MKTRRSADRAAHTRSTHSPARRLVCRVGAGVASLAVVIGLLLGIGMPRALSINNPTIVTTPTTPVNYGGSVRDLATLAGGLTPTGTITFDIGPSGFSCSYPFIPIASVSVPVNGNGTYDSTPIGTVANGLTPGTYEWLVSYTGDQNNSPVSDCTELTVVNKAPVAITTSASISATSGTISDTATLSGGAVTSGTVTFNLYGPNDPACGAATPTFTSTSTVVSDAAPVVTSAPFAASAPGRYRYVVIYSGDANNAGVTSPCNAPNESALAGQTVPTLTTAASASGTVGTGTISDTATLAGADTPTGTITFTAFGPNAATCGPYPVFTSPPVTVTGNGSYPSPAFTPPAPGTYQFVASYSGDVTNAPVTTVCGDPTESVFVSQARPTLATVQTTPVAYGSSIRDAATISGGFNPTGTLTFDLFPTGSSCDTISLATSSVPVSGNGTYNSALFPTVPNLPPGSYDFGVNYTGDANNVGSFDCSETVVVTTAAVSITTNSSPPVVLGSAISDTATIAGGVSPTGTITFSLFRGTCDSTALSTTTASVVGNGTYISAPFTPTSTGTYLWAARYSGDNLNAAAASACGATGETVAVSPTTTTPPTTIAPPTTTTPPTTTGPTTTRPVVTTATTRPRTTTTRRTTPPTTHAPATTIAPTTAPPTTAPPTTAPPTTVPPTTTTAPTTTTTTPPPPPTTLPPAGPTVVAVSLAGQPFGPAGVGVNISVVDLPASCATAYFYFDDTRIGAAPVHNGRASEGSLSAPGDAKAGDHRVSVSCRGSGRPVLQSTTFRVNPSSVHRTAFVTSLNEPRHLSVTFKSIGYSTLLAALLLLLLGFPSQVFNSTLQEHYEEVRGWFGMRRPLSEIVEHVNQRLLFPLFLLTGGVLYAWLTPDFGFNMSTLALVLGLGVAVAVTTVGFALPTFAFFRVRYRDRGKMLVMPGTVLVGAAFVLLSRLLHFQPGYLYGLLAVFVFHHEVDKKTGGRLAAVAALSVMGLALLAWVTRVPISGATMRPRVGFWTVVLESALCGAFIIGLESTLVGLLPMRFLDGSRIKEWSRTAWGALFAFALIVLIEVLIQPGTGYVGHTSTIGKITVATLYVIFAGFSLGFWAYFRYRRPRAESGFASEGDYGVR